ncbi:prolyl 4-hydroxylase [Oxalobacteraceae bacterium GrIS 1.11]
MQDAQNTQNTLQFEMVGIGIYKIPGLLTPEECAQHIAAAERANFQGATITRAGADQLDNRVRNNDRVIDDNPALADALWARAKLCMPPEMMGRRLLGLNPRLRYYRYVPGQRFKWHADGAYTNEAGQTSILTFMIYLNSDYEGGETRFSWTAVSPQAGMALVFDHSQSHEGTEVRSGTKYVLRSDVMSEEKT